MKGLKLASILACAVALCFSLAACGGGGSSSTSASASASAAATAPDFVGDWKLAAAESQGITMTGNFGMMFGRDEPTTLTINADGTGTMMFAGEGSDITWTQKDANTITITTASSTGVDVVYEDGALVVAMADAEFSGKLIFTRDGAYAKLKDISLTNAKDITSEDTLVGTWALSGMNLAGVTMFGDKAALSELAGGDDMTIVLESGGTGKAFGEAITWTVSPSGAVITSPDGALPVKALGNDIIIDASGATGSLDFGGASILFLFSK